MKHEMYKSSGEAGGEDNPQCRKTDRFSKDRFGRSDIGAKASIEHDKYQTGGTDTFRNRIIIKLYAYRPVYTEKHSRYRS